MMVRVLGLARGTELEWGLAAAGAVVAVVAWTVLRRWRRPTPQALERARRLRLNRIGRIAGGEILDALPPPLGASDPADADPAPTLVYRYQVSGVVYEASQPLYLVDAVLDPESWIPGWPVQVKFDPASPGNSIVVCEQWSGLALSARARAAAAADG